VAAHSRGLLDDDPEQLAAACGLLERGLRPLALASALEDLATIRVRSGDRAGGIEALGRALVIHADAGAGWDAARLRARLGLTNRETAARLFVSPHTVTSHLRHAFTKLGVNSRVELSRLIGEHDHQAQLTGSSSEKLHR
jgi:hypothetical protein